MKKGNKDILVNNSMFNTMSFYSIAISSLPILTLTGCGGGGNNTPVEVKTPQLGQTNISTQEYTKNIVKISDFCKDSTKVILDLSKLPSYYSLTDNNTTLTVDLTNVDVPEHNREVSIPVTCKNEDKSVDGNITSTEVDTANDVPYTITSSILPTSILSGQDYNATIKGTDPDGIPTISYKVLDGSDNNSTLTTGYMDCVVDTNNPNNSTCTTSISGLADNNNTYFTYNIKPAIGGEHPQADIEGSQKFLVEAPTFSLSGPTSGDDGGSYKISLNTNQDLSKLTFRYRGSYDENGGGQDYEGVITLGSTAIGGILSLDNNGNLIIDTTVTGYGDATSMGSGDWIEFEVEDVNGLIKIKRFTVN